MRSGDMLTRDELETICKDLDAMPWAVKAEMKAVRCAAAGRMARATSFGLSEEFTLSADELADIRRDGPADQPSGPRPEFAPKL